MVAPVSDDQASRSQPEDLFSSRLVGPSADLSERRINANSEVDYAACCERHAHSGVATRAINRPENAPLRMRALSRLHTLVRRYGLLQMLDRQYCVVTLAICSPLYHYPEHSE